MKHCGSDQESSGHRDLRFSYASFDKEAGRKHRNRRPYKNSRRSNKGKASTLRY